MSGLFAISVVVSFFAVIVFCVIAIKNKKADKAAYKKGMRYAGISFVIMIASTFGIEEVDETTTKSEQEIQGIVAQSNMEVEEAEADAAAKAKADEEARIKAEAEAAAEKAQAEAEAKAEAEAIAKAEAEAAAKAEAEAVAKAQAEEQAKAQVAQQQQQQASAARESFQNCTEMRKVYPSGVDSSHPAYASKHDRDKDGWACEK